MNQRIGYARVSTNGQNLNLQRDAPHLSGVRTIYEEGASGKVAGRKPNLDARQIREIERLMAERGIAVSQIAERYKVSRTTLCKVAPRGAAATISREDV